MVIDSRECLDKKITGTCLIDYNSQRKQRWDFAYYLPNDMGQLVRYSFKPKSSHRFKQEGLETAKYMQFSTTM